MAKLSGSAHEENIHNFTHNIFVYMDLCEISNLFGIVSRKELQVSWFGYKNDAALAGLSGLKTKEAKLAGALILFDLILYVPSTIFQL